MSNDLYSGFSSENLSFDHKLRRFSVPPEYRLHSHETLELFFLKKGDVIYITEHQEYPLPQNCLVISRPFERHMIRINDFTEYERYVILFDEKKIGTNFYKHLSGNVNIINFDGNSLVLDLFRKLDYYRKHLAEDALESMLAHLIEEIICNACLISKNIEQLNTCSVNPLIQQAQMYIDYNITKPISIDDICNTLYITKSHLHRLFMKHLNISPKQYILSQKLLRAKQEICLGNKPSNVCITYGFTNYSTFYRDYKKYFDHSPSEESQQSK